MSIGARLNRIEAARDRAMCELMRGLSDEQLEIIIESRPGAAALCAEMDKRIAWALAGDRAALTITAAEAERVMKGEA